MGDSMNVWKNSVYLDRIPAVWLNDFNLRLIQLEEWQKYQRWFSFYLLIN
jgi:hypothetical protein